MSNGVNNPLTSALSKLYVGLSQLPMNKVRELIIFAAVLCLLAMLAKLVWMLVPSDSSVLPSSKYANTRVGYATAGPATNGTLTSALSSSPRVDVNTMKSWHLFGSAELPDSSDEVKPESSEDYDDASETRLNLILLGIVQSNDPANGRAVIKHQAQSDLYLVGEKVPGGRNVVLERVLRDRVILDNRGRYESLFLYDEDDNKASPRAAANKPAVKKDQQLVDHRKNEDITDLANNYRKQLLENPMSLAEVIKISVAKDQNGNVMGYRVRPGRHRQQFKDVGLKSGDIVTEVNGMQLNDPSKAMELYTMMREATEASVIVKRGNENINLLLNISGN